MLWLTARLKASPHGSVKPTFTTTCVSFPNVVINTLECKVGEPVDMQFSIIMASSLKLLIAVSTLTAVHGKG